MSARHSSAGLWKPEDDDRLRALSALGESSSEIGLRWSRRPISEELSPNADSARNRSSSSGFHSPALEWRALISSSSLRRPQTVGDYCSAKLPAELPSCEWRQAIGS